MLSAVSGVCLCLVGAVCWCYLRRRLSSRTVHPWSTADRTRRKDGSLRYRAGDIIESDDAKRQLPLPIPPLSAQAPAADGADADEPALDIVEPLPEEVPLEELPDAPLDIPPAVVALADVKLMGDDYGGVWACTRSPARIRQAALVEHDRQSKAALEWHRTPMTSPSNALTRSHRRTMLYLKIRNS